MIDMITRSTVTIQVSGIEILALKKLSLVSHALAQKIGEDPRAYSAGKEQECLATVLDDVIRRIELAPVAREGT